MVEIQAGILFGALIYSLSTDRAEDNSGREQQHLKQLSSNIAPLPFSREVLEQSEIKPAPRASQYETPHKKHDCILTFCHKLRLPSKPDRERYATVPFH